MVSYISSIYVSAKSSINYGSLMVSNYPATRVLVSSLLLLSKVKGANGAMIHFQMTDFGSLRTQPIFLSIFQTPSTLHLKEFELYGGHTLRNTAEENGNITQICCCLTSGPMSQ